MSGVLHSIDTCIKNIRCATPKKTKKSVLGLGGRKVGRRIAAIFMSLITPTVIIIVHIAELSPSGEGTLELNT